MGRHSDLLKAAGRNDYTRILELFSGARGRTLSLSKSRKKRSQVPVWQRKADGTIERMAKPTTVKLECRDDDGCTPMLLAAAGAHLEAVECLVAYGANLDSRDSRGNTPLQLAAWSADPRADAVVEVLLKNGASPSLVNSDGTAALHYAAQSGKVYALMLLLDAGADPHCVTAEGVSAVGMAARFGKTEALKFLIDHDGTVLKDGRPLRESCMTNKKDVATFLVNQGIDVCDPDPETGDTPLHIAARFFRVEIAELLLRFGADPYCANAAGETAQSLVQAYPEAHPHRATLLKAIDESGDTELATPAVELDRREMTRAMTVTSRPEAPLPLLEPLEGQAPWTSDDPAMRSDAHPAHPPTNLFSAVRQLHWRAPGSGRQWVVVDFGGPYTITSVTIDCAMAGRHHPREFHLETASAVDGPWRTVTKHTVPVAPEREQDVDRESGTFEAEVGGFSCTSRFLRLMVIRTHGGSELRIHGVRFRGVDHLLKRWFTENGLLQHYDAFVAAGINQLHGLRTARTAQLDGLVELPGHRKKLMLALDRLRGEARLQLSFATPPAPSGVAGEPLAPFTIHAPPGASGEVVCTVVGATDAGGSLRLPLAAVVADGPVCCTFSEVVVGTPGQYRIECALAGKPKVKVAAVGTLMVEAPPSKACTEALFADFSQHLAFLRVA